MKEKKKTKNWPPATLDKRLFRMKGGGRGGGGGGVSNFESAQF